MAKRLGWRDRVAQACVREGQGQAPSGETQKHPCGLILELNVSGMCPRGQLPQTCAAAVSRVQPPGMYTSWDPDSGQVCTRLEP